jgi:chloride channel protein, CIC family
LIILNSDESRKSLLLTRYLNRSYLGKWAVIGVLIGIAAGFGATIFYYAIGLVSNIILGGLTGYYPPNPAGESPALPSISSPHFLLIPVSTAIGGLIAGLLIFNFAPEAQGHGTDTAIDAYHNKNGMIRRRVPIVKTIASVFTIGTGGSAGREGPMALIAAGFGSVVGDFFGLSAKDRRIAVAAGIGAGIGSIFKSPFGGAILSAEILYSGSDIEAEALIPSFIAAPVGYVIFALFTGFTPIFGSLIQYNFTDPWSLVFYAILGVMCAGVGRVYTTVFYSIKRIFDRSTLPRFTRPVLGAVIAGLIGIFFPEVLGLGYGFLQFAIDGNFAALRVNYLALPLFAILILLVIFKIIATSFTVGSGGSGGVFAPSLAIGGFLGALFWVVLHSLVPDAIPDPAPLVIVGMMALFAGVGRVPIAVILMVSEMTGNLSLLAPSMIAVVISYYLTGPNYTLYKSQVETRADSPAHRGEYNIPLMTKIFVEKAMTNQVVSLSGNDTVARANNVMKDKNFKGIPVVSDEDKVLGMITTSDLMRVPADQAGATQLKKIMTQNVISIGPRETLFDALRKMTTSGVGRLPVLDPTSGNLLGIITRTDLFRTYSKYVSEDQSSTGS